MKQLKLLAMVLATVLLATSCGDDDPNPYRIKHEPVDLGLSVKWAPMNVGATEPAMWGGLYGWGDSIGSHNVFNDDYPIEVSWKTVDGHEITTVKWSSPYFGGKTPLTNISGTDYDICKYKWNSDWRLPTKAEWEELIERCQWTIATDVANAQGTVYKVTGPNGKSILLPLGGINTTGSAESRGRLGNYWTSNLLPITDQHDYDFRSDVACAAWSVVIRPQNVDGSITLRPQLRHFHLSVRPVYAK